MIVFGTENKDFFPILKKKCTYLELINTLYVME